MATENFILLENGIDFIELEDNSGVVLLQNSSTNVTPFSFAVNYMNPIANPIIGIIDGQYSSS
jgi:hypothetical protein